MATRTILLDIGGTFIKCSDGREIPIDSAGPREGIVSSLRQAVKDYDAASVAIPGPFRYSDGTFLMKHKFASVYGERFQDLAGLETCSFAHDVNVMLLGELGLTKREGFDKVALVSLGTGLGFAMAVDGCLLTNDLGSPLVPIYNRPYRDGILEDYVSKRGFLRGYEGVTVKELAERAFGGDKESMARFDECGNILGQAIAPILEKMGVNRLLLGGQISRSYELFSHSLEAALSRVPTLRKISSVSDISDATFNGLRELARRSADGEPICADRDTDRRILEMLAV